MLFQEQFDRILREEHRSSGTRITSPPTLPTLAEAAAQGTRLALKACPLRQPLRRLPPRDEQVELIKRSLRSLGPGDTEGKLVAREPELSRFNSLPLYELPSVLTPSNLVTNSSSRQVETVNSE